MAREDSGLPKEMMAPHEDMDLNEEDEMSAKQHMHTLLGWLAIPTFQPDEI